MTWDTARIARDRVDGTLIWWYGALDPASRPQGEGKPPPSGACITSIRVRRVARAVDGPQCWAACSGDAVFEARIPTYAAVRIARDHRSAAVAIAQRQGDRVMRRVGSFPGPPLPEGANVRADAIEEHITGLRKRYPASVTAEVRYRPDGKVHRRARPGPLVLPTVPSWAIESGTGEPIVAAQAAMLAVHWAMTAPRPVSHRVRGL